MNFIIYLLAPVIVISNLDPNINVKRNRIMYGDKYYTHPKVPTFGSLIKNDDLET